MKKVALVFVLAVLLPSLVLAWLAVRSLRDQQFLLERQQSLLDQRVTDAFAQNISDYLAQRQQEFSAQVETLVADKDAREVAAQFDEQLRRNWPLAEVGFCVTLSGKILSPAPNARPEAQMFRLDNSGFLGNREPVEVYANAARNGGQNFNRAGQNQSFAANNSSSANFGSSFGGFGGGGGGGGGLNNSTRNSAADGLTLNGSAAKALALIPPGSSAVGGVESAAPAAQASVQRQQLALAETAQSDVPAATAAPLQEKTTFDDSVALKDSASQQTAQSTLNYKSAQARKVSPQSQAYQIPDQAKDVSDEQKNLSRVIPAEAEFSQLIGNETDGMLARFLQNKLKLMFWHRLNREPDLIFGAQLNLDRVVDGLRGLAQPDAALRDEICVAILDDNARPIVISRANFQANWKHPFVATEIGDALPHWEIAAYLVNPAQLTQAAHTAKLTLGLLIGVLVLAIGVGSWLIVSSLNTELKLARQKTDFVSNVSHELKTPLTSIRMFSELLAEGRVNDAAKQRSYLQIITAEAARLTRLINNVLDFSRMERGEKKYNFQPCDLTEVVRSTAETFRPHLEANGFNFDCELPAAPISIRGDADALSQIIVNLLSNAEKYSNGGKEITLQLAQKQSPLPHAEIKVLDRGAGIPRGTEEKVFEKFYRAHDSLSSGIQGSGLGLTIARQIARAHGGDVVFEPREGVGSCFVLRLPVSNIDKHG
jgi:signal transduction histidine kinase